MRQANIYMSLKHINVTVNENMIVDIDSIKINERLREVNHSKAEEIAESIKEIGLINPITLSEDHTLIAGLHRLNAFKMLGYKQIEANIVSLTGLKQELAEIDENLIRHDLHLIDRYDHLARRKWIYEQLYPETKQGVSQALGMNKAIGNNVSEIISPTFSEDTAKKTGLSIRTIEQEVQISESLNKTPEIKEMVKKADLSKTDTLKLVRIDEGKRKQVIEKVLSSNDNIDKVIKDIRKEELKEKREQILTSVNVDVPLPDKKYTVILADPPWRYTEATENRFVENHYPTMETDDICKLNIPSADDCILFLWATSGKLPEALKVMEAWGFEYKSSAVWNKMIVGMGYYFRGQHEFILIGRKGTPGIPKPEDRYSSIIEEKRTEHSKKPHIVYDMIEKMYPNREYLELFAREKHNEMWGAWGNQLE